MNPLPDNRLKKSSDNTRASREGEDIRRAAELQAPLAAHSEVRSYRDEFTFEPLPNPPQIPGWRFLWATTTNPSDPIHRRIRMGYQLVRAEELPGFDQLRIKSGEWEGCVSINEMLLMKITEDQYQAIMSEFHHIAPNEEAARLTVNSRADVRDSQGKRLIEDVSEGGDERVVKHSPHFD